MWPGAAYLNQQIVLTGGYDGDSRTNRAEVYKSLECQMMWFIINKREAKKSMVTV